MSGDRLEHLADESAGVQFASAMVPPGRQTRSNSVADRSGRGANITPNTLMTASKLASGYGSFPAFPSSNRAVSPSAAARPSPICGPSSA